MHHIHAVLSRDITALLIYKSRQTSKATPQMCWQQYELVQELTSVCHVGDWLL